LLELHKIPGFSPTMNLAKWLYRDGRPNRLAMVLNRWSGADTRLRGRPELSGHSGRARPAIRPHLPIHKDAPLSEFEQVSSQFPVFRVVPRSAEDGLPLDAHKDARR
jgi:hypothetical protein